VVSIDTRPDVAGQARRNPAVQGIGNVVVLAGDGTGRSPEFAPFDPIVVSAAYPRVPAPLAAQLRAGDAWSSRSAPAEQNMSSCTRRSSTACGGCGS
jgi:protein-L-isoaspartate O-methyltransferase